MVVLSMEVRSLEPLATWEPVGTLLDVLRGAFSGGEGLDAVGVARLRRWARRWRVLHPGLRAFYAAEVIDDPAGIASTALWRILDGSRAAFSPAQGFLLKQAWRARFGSFPAMELVPVLPEIDERH